MKVLDAPKISNLSTPEKIIFLEELWDSIASNEKIIVPESHKNELDKRLLKYQKYQGRLLTLKELQENIEKRK